MTVEAGARYGQLGQYLHHEGYALHNLASLPHISLAGACATADGELEQVSLRYAEEVAGIHVE